MTITEYFNQSTALLKKHGIKSARIDSLILIEFVTGINRAEILADSKVRITLKQKNVLNKLLRKRASYIPIAQLTNSREFYGRDFYINENVMIPRPETETMIELFKKEYESNPLLIKHRPLLVADVGTGSGVIGLTLKMELPDLVVDLIDISPKALIVTKINVVLHTMDVNVISNDLIKDLETNYDVLVCNLPYVPEGFTVSDEVKAEPTIAIYSGSDGLDIYRRLFSYITKTKNKPLLILTEALFISHKELRAIASDAKYKIRSSRDLIQVFEYSK